MDNSNFTDNIQQDNDILMDNSNINNDIHQNRDILKEIASINQQAKDQNAYKKTTNWHQQSANSQVGQTDQFANIIERLERIEEKLKNLVDMLYL